MRVCKGITLIDGVGFDSNIYIIDSEVLVDTGTGLFFNETKKEMEALGFNSRQIKTIVNTHCHFDHTGGNKKFRNWLKAEILIHNADKKALETGSGTLAEFFNEQPRTITVDRTLREGNIIATKNFRFKIISTPGHTKGSICLYEPMKKILISGDTLFEDGAGRTDLESGNKEKMFESLKKLSELQIIYLLPGHGMPKSSGANFLLKQLLHCYERRRNFKLFR